MACAFLASFLCFAPSPVHAGVRFQQVTPSEFNRLAALHAGEGRRVTGPALAALSAALASGAETTASSPGPEADRVSCENPDSLKRQDCLDSLSSARAANARRDSLIRGREYVPAESDAAGYEQERARGWFAQFFYEWGHGGGEDGGHWDAGDWAAVIYVVVGVVVVGAFVIYGIQAIYDLAVNRDRSPVFHEAGLRFSYSGKAYRDQPGPTLYRDAYLMGLRYAIGLDRGFLGLGVTAEGGYIDLAFRGVDEPSQALDFRGGYLVAGPMIRFGHNDPMSFNLEFLNGTSDHRSIGWISKSRMTLEGKLSRGILLGAHLGAVFYDLHPLDGLGIRGGSFNRDLSLISGVDIGWAY